MPGGCPGDPPGHPRGTPGASPGHPRGTPGNPRGSPGIPGDFGGRPEDPGGRVPAETLFWGRTFRVNGLKPLRLSTKKGFPELKELSQAQPAVPAKVVSGPRPGTTLLHAPGTKMT